jgi:hypothetical protein
MIVNTDQIRIGVKKYIENEIAYKANGITKFMVYFVLPSVDVSVVGYVNKMRENSLFSDMFDQDGNIYLDKVYDRATFAVDKSGKVLLEKFGLSLDRSDVEKLYSYIRES